MRRNALGILALILLLAGALLLFSQATPAGVGSMAGGAIKIGLVLGAFWLALPQIDRFLAKVPMWLTITSFAGLILIVIRPWSALVVVPVVIGLWILSFKLTKKK